MLWLQENSTQPNCSVALRFFFGWVFHKQRARFEPVCFCTKPIEIRFTKAWKLSSCFPLFADHIRSLKIWFTLNQRARKSIVFLFLSSNCKQHMRASKTNPSKSTWANIRPTSIQCVLENNDDDFFWMFAWEILSHNSVFFSLIAVPFIPFHFFLQLRQNTKKKPAKRELAHVENKVEQFIVILRDIFEYFFLSA